MITESHKGFEPTEALHYENATWFKDSLTKMAPLMKDRYKVEVTVGDINETIGKLDDRLKSIRPAGEDDSSADEAAEEYKAYTQAADLLDKQSAYKTEVSVTVKALGGATKEGIMKAYNFILRHAQERFGHKEPNVSSSDIFADLESPMQNNYKFQIPIRFFDPEAYSEIAEEQESQEEASED